MIILSQMNNYGKMNFYGNTRKYKDIQRFSRDNENSIKTIDEIKYGKTKRFMIK